jgi:hypothetical protein
MGRAVVVQFDRTVVGYSSMKSTMSFSTLNDMVALRVTGDPTLPHLGPGRPVRLAPERKEVIWIRCQLSTCCCSGRSFRAPGGSHRAPASLRRRRGIYVNEKGPPKRALLRGHWTGQRLST